VLIIILRIINSFQERCSQNAPPNVMQHDNTIQ